MQLLQAGQLRENAPRDHLKYQVMQETSPSLVKLLSEAGCLRTQLVSMHPDQALSLHDTIQAVALHLGLGHSLQQAVQVISQPDTHHSSSKAVHIPGRTANLLQLVVHTQDSPDSIRPKGSILSTPPIVAHIQDIRVRSVGIVELLQVVRIRHMEHA